MGSTFRKIEGRNILNSFLSTHFLSKHIAYYRVIDNAILLFNFQVNLRTLERIAGQNVTIDKELVNGVVQWAFVARWAGMTILMVVMEPLVAKLGMNVP